MIAYFERFQVKMTKEQALQCSHPGPCDNDVKDTIPQLRLALDPEKVRAELKEYGAWSDDELSNDDDNIARVVWLAAGMIRDDLQERARK